MTFKVEVSPAHQQLAQDIVGVLRNQYPGEDALIVLIVAVVLAARATGYPSEMIDNVLTVIAQMHPERGPVAKAVLDVLADEMEKHSGN